MEKERDEGGSLQGHPYSGKDNKSFPRDDYSIEERTSQFCSHKECKIKDYGAWMCPCKLDEEDKEDYNQQSKKNKEKSISKY